MACALCKEQKPLRNSHIISEFLYTPLYNEDHKYTQISTDHQKFNKRLPRGIYEKLLCGDCEAIINKYEDYACKALFGGVTTKKSNLQNQFVIEELDYNRFKLFQLSILWRAGVSRREEFSKVTLGITHSERLRKMILNGNPGEVYEYGTILISSPRVMNIIADLILPPEPIRLGNYRVYRALFAGLFWFFFTSGHTREFLHQEAFLSKDGKLIIYKENSKSVEFITKLGLAFKSAGKI